MKIVVLPIASSFVLTTFLAHAALGDDLDAKVRYNQQKTRWAIEESKRKIEASRANMQSAHGTQSSSQATSPRASVQTYSSNAAGSTAAQTAVWQLFQQYRSLDLSNDPRIIHLYADNATIDVLGQRYNKSSYGQYVAAAYSHPAAGLNTHTQYGQPQFLSITNDSANLKFVGSLGVATMTVFWTVRRNPSNAWQIVSERFVNGRQ